MDPSSPKPDVSRAGANPDIFPTGSTKKELPRLEWKGAVDADGHILEPPELWREYLEPKYRDRALCIRKDDEGREYLEIDGKSSRRVRRAIAGHTWRRG